MQNSLMMPEEMQIHQDPLPNKLNGYLLSLGRMHNKAPPPPLLYIHPAYNVKNNGKWLH